MACKTLTVLIFLLEALLLFVHVSLRLTLKMFEKFSILLG